MRFQAQVVKTVPEEIEIPDFPADVMEAVEEYDAEISTRVEWEQSDIGRYAEMWASISLGDSDRRIEFEDVLTSLKGYDELVLPFDVENSPYAQVDDPDKGLQILHSFVQEMHRRYPKVRMNHNGMSLRVEPPLPWKLQQEMRSNLQRAADDDPPRDF